MTKTKLPDFPPSIAKFVEEMTPEERREAFKSAWRGDLEDWIEPMPFPDDDAEGQAWIDAIVAVDRRSDYGPLERLIHSGPPAQRVWPYLRDLFERQLGMYLYKFGGKSLPSERSKKPGKKPEPLWVQHQSLKEMARRFIAKQQEAGMSAQEARKYTAELFKHELDDPDKLYRYLDQLTGHGYRTAQRKKKMGEAAPARRKRPPQH